jgi:two-component system cell cycle response regulator
VDDERRSAERIVGALSPHHDVIRSTEPGEALAMAREEEIDLMIVGLGLGGFDGLRLCSRARSHERTRNLPILLIADPEDRPKVLRGLELGVNDYLTRPIDRNEVLARVRTNIRQKRYADRLRRSVQQSIEMALYDALTGLNNRRSLERRLPAMIETARQRGAPLTMMILDIDHFKRVNDTHGHAVGDLVLKGFAAQLQEIVRGGDLLCRLGGEEFVVVMPGVDGTQAARIADARAGPRRTGSSHSRPRLTRSRSRSPSVSRNGGSNGIPPSFIAAPTARSICPSGGPQPRHSGRGVIRNAGPQTWIWHCDGKDHYYQLIMCIY